MLIMARRFAPSYVMQMDQPEPARVAALKSYGILDTPNEVEFDRIVRRAAQILHTPIALISLVDEEHQWFKARIGLEPEETPKAISFCTHAIRGSDVFVVEDATRDVRFATSPLVTGAPNIRFYAGAPLRMASGVRIGTICVIDSEPRAALNEKQRAELRALADHTVALVEARRKR